MESDDLKALREEITGLRRDVARLERVLGMHQPVPLPALPYWRPTYQPLYPGGPWPAVSGFGARILAADGVCTTPLPALSTKDAALAPSTTPQHEG